MLKLYREIRNFYGWGKHYLTHEEIVKGNELNNRETSKTPLRNEVINFLLQNFKKDGSIYLEIGVRNPSANFDLIKAKTKYSVDPGLEFEENPVDFKMTSNDFFDQLRKGQILSRDIKFDLIFIDGLHLADQVESDIENALDFISDSGFIVLHDCNPPSEWHCRDNYGYRLTPASKYWNGTTWKAFVSFRKRSDYFSCCVDTDWGVGIIHKHINLGNKNTVKNDYFEYSVFDKERKASLNLISFEDFQSLIQNQK